MDKPMMEFRLLEMPTAITRLQQKHMREEKTVNGTEVREVWKDVPRVKYVDLTAQQKEAVINLEGFNG